MGPPPPTPRIEGQQHNNSNNRRPMRASDSHSSSSAPVSSSAPLSSYASLASAPPPSFARKSSSTGPGAGGGGPSSSADYHRSLSAASSSGSYRGSSSSIGGSIGGGRHGGRYSDVGGRVGGRGAGPGRPYRGGGIGGRGGRFEDRPGGRGGRMAPMDEGGGRFSYSSGPRRSSVGATGPSSGGGRFEAGRGRGRGGRDYMYASRGRGRTAYRGGGRGGRGDGYETRTSSYSSFDDPPLHSSTRSVNTTEDLDAGDGRLPPGERFGRSGIGSEGTANSYSAAAAPRRSYGSFASLSEAPSDFRRSSTSSQQQDDKHQQLEEGEDPGYPVGTTTGTSIANKRRREDIYPGEAGQLDVEHAKRQARDNDNEEGLVLPGDPVPSANTAPGGYDKEGEARLADEGRRAAVTGAPRDSPHSERRRFSGNQFEDAAAPPLRSYDDSMHDSSSSYRDLGGYGGRGRGRSSGRGRGIYRGGGRGEYNGGRYGDRDARLSISAPSEGRGRGGPPEESPRGTYAQYSDLGSTSAATPSSWRRRDDDGGPQPSPRGGASDWRRPSTSSASNRTSVVSSYATLAANPMPPTKPSPRPIPASTTTTKESAGTPAPAPAPKPVVIPKKKALTPPPSPGPPSALTVALIRLADLESEVEFAYAKHIMLAKRHKVLLKQYEHLEGLPVGVEAFEDELKALVNADTTAASEDNALYGS